MRLPRRRDLLIALGVVAAGSAVYVAVLVLRAHRQTPAVMSKARMLDENDLRSEDLPEEWKAILLQVEDPGFYDHNGVDLSTPGAGMTTITQAIVKGHYFESFSPGLHAKIRQSLSALVLDRRLSKDLQLTLFLHTAGLGTSEGGPVVGFPAAARVYFGKGLPELEREEFVTLVAMLVGPNAYHPTARPAKLAERVARVEALLAGRCEPAGLRDVYYAGCAE